MESGALVIPLGRITSGFIARARTTATPSCCQPVWEVTTFVRQTEPFEQLGGSASASVLDVPTASIYPSVTLRSTGIFATGERLDYRPDRWSCRPSRADLLGSSMNNPRSPFTDWGKSMQRSRVDFSEPDASFWLRPRFVSTSRSISRNRAHRATCGGHRNATPIRNRIVHARSQRAPPRCVRMGRLA